MPRSTFPNMHMLACPRFDPTSPEFILLADAVSEKSEPAFMECDSECGSSQAMGRADSNELSPPIEATPGDIAHSQQKTDTIPSTSREQGAQLPPESTELLHKKFSALYHWIHGCSWTVWSLAMFVPLAQRIRSW